MTGMTTPDGGPSARGEADATEGDARSPRERSSSEADRQAAELARAVAQRAIRRLDVLEWVIFLGGAILATLLGGLAAWLLAGIAGWSFRSTWVWASILLFVVPGIISIVMIKRDERRDARRSADTGNRHDG